MEEQDIFDAAQTLVNKAEGDGCIVTRAIVVTQYVTPDGGEQMSSFVTSMMPWDTLGMLTTETLRARMSALSSIADIEED